MIRDWRDEPVREDEETDEEWERRLDAFNDSVESEINRRMEEDCK